MLCSIFCQAPALGDAAALAPPHSSRSPFLGVSLPNSVPRGEQPLLELGLSQLSCSLCSCTDHPRGVQSCVSRVDFGKSLGKCWRPPAAGAGIFASLEQLKAFPLQNCGAGAGCQGAASLPGRWVGTFGAASPRPLGSAPAQLLLRHHTVEPTLGQLFQHPLPSHGQQPGLWSQGHSLSSSSCWTRLAVPHHGQTPGSTPSPCWAYTHSMLPPQHYPCPMQGEALSPRCDQHPPGRQCLAGSRVTLIALSPLPHP